MLEVRRGTKWEILRCLREDGEATLRDLEDEMDRSPSTLNEHLSDLQAREYVDKRSVRDGPGRPHYVYFLTEEAEHLFPHAYAELATMLLDVIRSLTDEPDAREKVAGVITEQLREHEDLETALDRLGYYPETEENEDGSYLLEFHQCPFHDVAKEDPSLCGIDRSALEELSGGTVEMERSIVDGANTCRFTVSSN